MTIRVRTAGALQTITGGKVKVAGIVRNIRSIKVMDNGTLRTVATFASPFSIDIAPDPVSGTAYSIGAATVTTSGATATPTGGLAPFTYAWTFVSKSGGDTPTANSPAFATTTFKQTNVALSGSNTAVMRCTATDAFGTTATDTVTAQFSNEVDTGDS